MKQRTLQAPIRLGLIGCGSIVRNVHAPSYQALTDLVQVTAVADPFASNRDQIAATLGVPSAQCYADYRDMLAQAPIDVVTIATPHHLHVEHVVQAAQAGKAIIAEKPMATNMAEANAIREAVVRYQVPYAIVHNLLYSVPMQEALAQLRDGQIGQPYYGRAQCYHNKAALGPVTGEPWRNRKDTGGGCLADTAYHEIYCTEALMGSPICRISAQVKTVCFDLDVDDMALMLFEHENGKLSTVSTGWGVPVQEFESGRWVEVHGTRGSLRVLHRVEGPVLRYIRADGGERFSAPWQPLELPGLEKIKAGSGFLVGHLGFFAATLQALAKGDPTPTNVETARHILSVIEAARQASASGCTVDLREFGAQ